MGKRKESASTVVGNVVWFCLYGTNAFRRSLQKKNNRTSLPPRNATLKALFSPLSFEDTETQNERVSDETAPEPHPHFQTMHY